MAIELHEAANQALGKLGALGVGPPFAGIALGLVNPRTGKLAAYINSDDVLVDANGDEIVGGGGAVAAEDITDGTATGVAVITAATAAAGATALGLGSGDAPTFDGLALSDSVGEQPMLSFADGTTSWRVFPNHGGDVNDLTFRKFMLTRNLREINVRILANSVAVATVVTTAAPHMLETGDFVAITGSNSTPSIDGTPQEVIVLSPTTFSLDITVTVAGTAGLVAARIFDDPVHSWSLTQKEDEWYDSSSTERWVQNEFNITDNGIRSINIVTRVGAKIAQITASNPAVVRTQGAHDLDTVTPDAVYIVLPTGSTDVTAPATVANISTTATVPAGTTRTCTTVDTNTTVTLDSGNTTGLYVGYQVSGAGIPANAYVVSITDATHFVMSLAATASAGGVSVTFASTHIFTIPINTTAGGVTWTGAAGGWVRAPARYNTEGYIRGVVSLLHPVTISTSEVAAYGLTLFNKALFGRVDALVAGESQVAFLGDYGSAQASHIHYGLTGDWYIRPGLATGKIVICDQGTSVAIGSASSTLGFHGVAATAQQTLATGTGATVDNVITALQALGLVKQS